MKYQSLFYVVKVIVPMNVVVLPPAETSYLMAYATYFYLLQIPDSGLST